jgi:hypothetical protein
MFFNRGLKMKVNMRKLTAEKTGWEITDKKSSQWTMNHSGTSAKGNEFAYSHESYLSSLASSRSWQQKDIDKKQQKIDEISKNPSALDRLRGAYEVVSEYDNSAKKAGSNIKWYEDKKNDREQSSNELDNEWNQKKQEFIKDLSDSLGKEDANKIADQVFSKAEEFGKEGVDDKENVFAPENIEKSFGVKGDLASKTGDFLKSAYINRFMSNSYAQMGKYYEKVVENANEDANPTYIKNAKEILKDSEKEYFDNINSNEDISSYPDYNPDEYNKNNDVLRFANCFAYAASDPMNHKLYGKMPDPGDKSVGKLMSLSGEFVMQQAENDGFISTSSKTPKDLPGFYQVALVSSTQGSPDYHWYKKCKDGYWSHKIGRKAAKDVDESGKKIIDPMIADRGVYGEFVGYMYVPQGGIEVGHKGRYAMEQERPIKEKRAEVAVVLPNGLDANKPEEILGSETKERFVLTSALRSIGRDGSIDEARFCRFMIYSDFEKKPSEEEFLKTNPSKGVVSGELLENVIKAYSKGDEKTQKRFSELSVFKRYQRVCEKHNSNNKNISNVIKLAKTSQR